MKTRFDWQTEENSKLENAELGDMVPSSRRKLGCLTMTLIVVAIAISLFAWLLNDRQSEAIANVSEEVLLAFELQRQAAENDDKELFSALLSSSDPDWKREQKRLHSAALFFDRGSIGLVADGESRTQPVLDLSPDLQKAELSYSQAYTAVTSSPESSNIELLHTLVYRLEDGRWLNAARRQDFWGSWNEVEGELISITTPERDAELARQLGDRINAHLRTVCSELDEDNEYGLAFCEGHAPWRIKLSTDDATVLNLADTLPAQSSEFDYELPAPTIVGVPLNESDFEAFFDVYTRSLLPIMEAALSSAVPFPDQSIYALCFAHPLNGRHLYRYDWRLRLWRPLLPAQTFQHLSSLPDDSAIMLADGDTLTVMVGNRDPASTSHAEVWQGDLPSFDSHSLIGWIPTEDAPYHLLQHAALAGELPRYSALLLRDCDARSCVTTELPGFPVPSTTSSAFLYSTGSEIVLGEEEGTFTQPVGTGFSPFWVDERTFGFVRFAGDIDSGISTQVVVGNIDTAELQVLFDGEDLAREADILWDSVLYVNEVIPNPADPDLLLVSSTGIRDYSGNYYIFSADIARRLNQPTQPELNLELARSGSQGGVPGLMTPTGPPPFLISSDGRWLAMTELNSQDSETWTILIHDLQTGTTSEVRDNVPAMPGNFPQLDWSGNGQWLLVADRNYLQLIDPAHEYQKLIAHQFDACSHIVWAD